MPGFHRAMSADDQPHGSDRRGLGLRDQTRRFSFHVPAPRGPRARVLAHDWAGQLPAVVEAMRALPAVAAVRLLHVVVGWPEVTRRSVFSVQRPLRRRFHRKIRRLGRRSPPVD